MARLAFRAEAAFVAIVGLVAAVTADRQARRRGGSGVTAIATEPGVAAGQRKARAIMIEPRTGPARGLVARLAPGRSTEPAFVRDVGVTAGTCHPGGAELRVAMAVGAGCTAVRARQRKARRGMVEPRCGTPAVDGVARRAIPSQLALVDIPPRMAAGTFARRFDAVDGFDVARGATHPLVRPVQWETRRLVMIEKRAFPADGRMTARAIAAIVPLVNIVLAVAGRALHRWPQALVLRPVAGGAGRRAMQADQRKTRSAMIEQRPFPTQLRMTACAVGAVAPLVDIIRPMTCDALFRRPGKTASDMAIGAGDRLVCPDELETGRCMIEFVDILPAAFAVAGGTILAEAVLMDVVLDVARDANGGCGAKLRARFMALGAGQAAMLAVDGKVGPAMIEAGALEVGGEFDRPLMFEMTGAALLFRRRGRAAMKSGARADIAGDAGMACLAFSILRRGSERIMAGRAARLELGMGGTKRARTDQSLERRAQGQQSPDHCQKHQRPDKNRAAAHQYMWTASTCSAAVITRKRKSGRCR